MPAYNSHSASVKRHFVKLGYFRISRSLPKISDDEATSRLKMNRSCPKIAEGEIFRR